MPERRGGSLKVPSMGGVPERRGGFSLSKSGLTLVEVMMAMFLVSMAAIIVYTEMMLAYRMQIRSRGRLEAQSIAFDRVWEIYNLPLINIETNSNTLYSVSTPAWSVLGTGGVVDVAILTDTNNVDPIYWEIAATVWPPTNTPLQVGTNPLYRAVVWRYRGER